MVGVIFGEILRNFGLWRRGFLNFLSNDFSRQKFRRFYGDQFFQGEPWECCKGTLGIDKFK